MSLLPGVAAHAQLPVFGNITGTNFNSFSGVTLSGSATPSVRFQNGSNLVEITSLQATLSNFDGDTFMVYFSIWTDDTGDPDQEVFRFATANVNAPQNYTFTADTSFAPGISVTLAPFTAYHLRNVVFGNDPLPEPKVDWFFSDPDTAPTAQNGSGIVLSDYSGIGSGNPLFQLGGSVSTVVPELGTGWLALLAAPAIGVVVRRRRAKTA